MFYYTHTHKHKQTNELDLRVNFFPFPGYIYVCPVFYTEE